MVTLRRAFPTGGQLRCMAQKGYLGIITRCVDIDMTVFRCFVCQGHDERRVVAVAIHHQHCVLAGAWSAFRAWELGWERAGARG